MIISNQGLSDQYVPAQQYSDKRANDLPRINVPVADLEYRDGEPSFQISRLHITPTSTKYGNPNFLKALADCNKLEVSHSMLSWDYKNRREAQPILPFLFLGPSSVARDPSFVQSSGITLIIAVRSAKAVQTRPSFLDPTKLPSSAGLDTLTFDFDEPAEFISLVKPTIRAINEHLEAKCTSTQAIEEMRGKVLVYCESGNERSAMLVAAYLIIVLGIGALDAVRMVQSQRFCINLVDESKHALLNLQGILEAERQVSDAHTLLDFSLLPSSQNGNPRGPPARSVKRSLNDFYASDSDDAMDFADGIASVGGRQGMAPFADALG